MLGNGEDQLQTQVLPEETLENRDVQGQQECEECEEQRKVSLSHIAHNVVAVCSGIVFGFVLDKATTNMPFTVASQFDLTIFLMMRMFLAACATSIAVVLVLDLSGVKQRTPKCGLALGFGRLGGYGANLVGGALLGIGMFLSGSCPGTVWAQLGALVPNVWAVMVGCVLGAVAFGYVHPKLQKARPAFHSSKAETRIEPQKIGYHVTSFAFIVCCSICIWAFNYFLPWQEDMAQVLQDPVGNPTLFDLTEANWDPLLSGILLGLLQLPIQLTYGGSLGSSSAWVWMAANLVGLVDKRLETHSPFLFKAKQNKVGIFQLLVGAGIAGGAALSQFLGGYPALTPQAQDFPTIARQLFGGFFIL